MERYTRLSTAIDRTLSPKVRVSFTYALGRFGNQLRGVDLNAPVNGVRPDPKFASLIEAVSDASTHMQDFVPDLNINLAGGDRSAASARWNPRRTVFRFNYRYRRTFNDSDGAFMPSPTGSLDTEWAPSSNDTASPDPRLSVEPGPEEPQRATDSRQQQRRAVHDHDRSRRQRRFASSTTARSCSRAIPRGCRRERRCRPTSRT